MRRHHVTAVALLVLGLAAPAAQSGKPSTDAALALVRVYLTQWQHTLAALVAEEEYNQELSRGSGQGSRDRERRRLRSELLLLLRVPAENRWLSFRDVIAVDGKAVTDRPLRFDALFTPAGAMVPTAERMAAEASRFNLGTPRTTNTPTAALVFLNPQFDGNTEWNLDASERLDARSVWRLRFKQNKPPFAVIVPGIHGQTSTGSFWLEPDTGAILKCELRVRTGRTIHRVTTSYGAVPSITEGRVPLRMEEDYSGPFEQFAGVATYSKHRLFRTGGRIIGF